MEISTADRNELNHQLKVYSTENLWSNIRLRKSTTGKGYVLHRVDHRLKAVLLASLFEQEARILSPIVTYGDYFAVHFACSHELAVKLANTFPPLKIEELIPISKDGTKILANHQKAKAKNFQTLMYNNRK